MSNDEKKEYLNGYKYACRKILCSKEQLDALVETEQSAKIQQLSDMPKGGGRQSDLSDVLVSIERLQNMIDDKIVESLRIKVDIESKIFNVEEPDEARLLRLRYIDFKTWEEIACLMHYSYRQTLYIHGRALSNFMIA